MTAHNTAEPVAVRATHRLAYLPLAAGATAVATLGIAILMGPSRITPLVVGVLGLAALGLLGAELARRMARLRAEVGAGVVGLVALGLVNVALLAWLLGGLSLGPLIVPAALMVAGGVLVGLTLGRVTQPRDENLTPWQAMAAGTTGRDADQALRVLGPALAGLALIVLASALVLRRLAFAQPLTVLAGLVLMGLVTVVPAALVTLWVVRRRAPHTQASAPVARGPQEVAAHLHDSVLQTLALIQRRADDPAAVTQLARRQEHDLRDWLAGRDRPGADAGTLAAALKRAAREVEEAHAGAAVDVVTVGDVPLTEALVVTVEAAREAMLNAARHAGPRVRVYAECEDEGVVTVFVRDTGPGFRLDDVPPERRGVRDAIVGRMDGVGGEAVIDSTEAGTEVMLRVPKRTTP